MRRHLSKKDPTTKRTREAHILIVEKAIGRLLPKGAEVHHVDRNGHNNIHSNLVVCPDHKYHMLLHTRQRALDGCGNPNLRKCTICKQWDNPVNMYHNKTKGCYSHVACKQKDRHERYLKRKEKTCGK